jgi:hypothetical protein
MKKIKIVSIVIFFSSFLCSLNITAQISTPEEGKALVVFYRTKKFSGGAIQFNVRDSDKYYGPLKNGTIIKVNIDPGEHTFFSQVISSDAITLNVEEGKTYYVKGTVKMGYYAGRPKFNQVDEKTALKEMKSK